MYIVEDGLVYNCYNSNNNEIKLCVGGEKTTNKIETEESTIYTHVIFDVEQQMYVEDVENTDLIIVDGIEYLPLMGKIFIFK